MYCIGDLYEDGEVWEDNDSSDCEDEGAVLPELESDESTTRNGRALLTWLLVFLLRMQAKHYIPDAALNSLLKFLYAFLLIISLSSEFIQHIIRVFPKSVHNLRKFFNFREQFTQ